MLRSSNRDDIPTLGTCLTDKRHSMHPTAKFTFKLAPPTAALTTAAGFSKRPNISSTNAQLRPTARSPQSKSPAHTTQTQGPATRQYSLLRQHHPQCSASIPDPNQHHPNQTPRRRKAKTTRRKAKDKAHSSCPLASRAQVQTRIHRALRKSTASRRTSWRSRYVGGKASRCST